MAKVAVTKMLLQKPHIIIMDEPTKGIDVGAKAEFYQMICDFAKQGMGVILISSEMPEVIGLSDRVIVMRGLKIVGELDREEVTEDVTVNDDGSVVIRVPELIAFCERL